MIIPTTVDTSKYNRLVPNPDLLKLRGVQTILLSATPDGFGLMNVYFPEAVKLYRAAGLKVEAFHTWYPGPLARDQVDAFRMALDLAHWEGDPVEIDIERAGLPILANGEATDNAWAVTTGIANLGCLTRIYTSKYMWESKVRIVRGRYPWQRYPLHVAHWGTENNFARILVPWDWRAVGWVRLQYAGDVAFAGTDGVDLNLDR